MNWSDISIRKYNDIVNVLSDDIDDLDKNLRLLAVIKDMDIDEAEELIEECDEWMDTLSDEDYDIADEIVSEYEDKIEALYELAELAEEASDLDW